MAGKKKRVAAASTSTKPVEQKAAEPEQQPVPKTKVQEEPMDVEAKKSSNKKQPAKKGRGKRKADADTKDSAKESKSSQQDKAETKSGRATDKKQGKANKSKSKPRKAARLSKSKGKKVVEDETDDEVSEDEQDVEDDEVEEDDGEQEDKTKKKNGKSKSRKVKSDNGHTRENAPFTVYKHHHEKEAYDAELACVLAEQKAAASLAANAAVGDTGVSGEAKPEKEKAIVVSKSMVNKRLRKSWNALTPEQKAPYEKPRNDAVYKIRGPKAPLSAYMFFAKEYSKQHPLRGVQVGQAEVEEAGNQHAARFKQVAMEKGKAWKAMSDAQKQPYEAKHKAAQEAFLKEVAEWKRAYPDQELPVRAENAVKKAEAKDKAEAEAKAKAKPDANAALVSASVPAK